VIDDQTGEITSRRGSHGRTFALAVLSVGTRATSWPVVFEPGRAFKARPRLELTQPRIPQIRVRAFNATDFNPSAPPPQNPLPPPVNASVRVPAPPVLPSFPPAAASPMPPPPPPQVPPPPPSHKPAAPIDVTVSVVGVTVPPTTGVTAQPTPPVNPSPPSGARREAKQRQAATAKSEEGGGQEGGEAHGRIDSVDSPNAPATRLPPRKPEPHAFTAIAHREQASAWAIGLELGGGMTLLALALALGFTTVRPTPRTRRRPPVVPAPAWNRTRTMDHRTQR
jgi:hypothetical protein